MGSELANTNDGPGEITRVLVQGDLKGLTEPQRAEYYNSVCSSLGLNPLTRPFDFMTLNGKLLLYAKKDCTEQLRNIHSISLAIVGREMVDGVYVVTTRATTPAGRTDESVGAVTIKGLQGENLANAFMKAETKSKRRVTLSICGLGLLDESEVSTIGTATTEPAKAAPVAAITNGKSVVGLATEKTLGAIVEARPAWLRSFGIDTKDEAAVKEFWSARLLDKYGAKSAREMLERDALELLEEVRSVGHQQEIKEMELPPELK